MGWNKDGTCTPAGGGFNCNRSSVQGGVFGTDDAPSSRAPRQQVGFSLDAVDAAADRDAQHMRQMQAMQQQQQMQQQRQQQMAMQQQRQQQMAMQQQRQQQMATQQQRQQQMAMQQQQQQQQQMMMMQRQQQQQQQQRMPAPPSPPSEVDMIKKKNQTSSLGFEDCWDSGAASYRGGKQRKGITSKDTAVPKHGGYGSGMNFFDAPAAGGGQRPDQRAHLGSNICFG